MLLRNVRILLGVGVFTALLSQAAAQQPPRSDDYRQFFKKPVTVAEYWNALKFEMEVGRYDLAAGHLRGLLLKKPTPEDLVALEKAEGMVTFLRLRLVPRWIDIPSNAAE